MKSRSSLKLTTRQQTTTASTGKPGSAATVAESTAKTVSFSSSTRDGKKLRRVSISDGSDDEDNDDIINVEEQQHGGQFPTEFLDLRPFDINVKCPTFSTLSERDLDQHPLNVDEIDLVQFELEKLLYHVIVRTRRLREAVQDASSNAPSFMQMTSSESGLSKKYATTRFGQAQTASTAASAESSKRSKQKLPERGKRSASGTDVSSLKVKPPKMARYDSSSNAATTNIGGDRGAVSPGTSRVFHLWPQNQMPFKFVTFVDSFADPITDVDIYALQSMLDEYTFSDTLRDSGSAQDLKDVPTGKHSEDNRSFNIDTKVLCRTMKNGETMNNAAVDELTKKLSTSKLNKSTARSTGTGAKKNKTATGSNNNATTRNESHQQQQFSLGPLTEHLIQALIEESAFIRTNFNGTEECPFSNYNNCVSVSSANTSTSSSAKNFAKSFNLGNLVAWEQMIKKELDEQGLLDINQETTNGLDYKSEKEDEVSDELKQRRLELAALQKSNYQKVKKLLELGERKLEQQNLEQKLKESDDNIQELCSRFYGVPPVIKRPSTKKEKELLWKAVKDRKESLNNLMNGTGY